MVKTEHRFITIEHITAEEAKEHCHMGEGESCCAYLVSGSTGLECVRMDPRFNIQIKLNLMHDLMIAKYEGGDSRCYLRGEI